MKRKARKGWESFLGRRMIRIKNKKVYGELKKSGMEFHKEVLNDKKELEDFRDSNFLSSLGEGIFWMIVLILDSYLLMTEKLSWIILLSVTILVLCGYYLYKKKKHEKNLKSFEDIRKERIDDDKLMKNRKIFFSICLNYKIITLVTLILIAIIILIFRI